MMGKKQRNRVTGLKKTTTSRQRTSSRQRMRMKRNTAPEKEKIQHKKTADSASAVFHFLRRLQRNAVDFAPPRRQQFIIGFSLSSFID